MTTIYCGTEDRVEFFKEIAATIGMLEVFDYEVKLVDGEYEVVLNDEEYR